MSPDGRAVYALRSAVDSPPAPVRIDPERPSRSRCGCSARRRTSPLPGRLTEVTTTADDGVPLRAWLVLPETAAPDRPAPLLLWIHGGPLSSWNAWSWRWNPWLMAARGYAVLLPDPALSTGYGHDFIQRGWGAWGGEPFTDLMAITDAAVARPDIDGDRTAAMGGSFGGYMANWVATQTDRFRAIVTHASLWHLDAFAGTTDDAVVLVARVRRPAAEAGAVPGELAAPAGGEHPHPDAGDPRRQGLPGADRRGAAALVRPGPRSRCRRSSSTSRTRTTGCSPPATRRSGTRPSFAFLAQHVLGQEWRRPELL